MRTVVKIHNVNPNTAEAPASRGRVQLLTESKRRCVPPGPVDGNQLLDGLGLNE